MSPWDILLVLLALVILLLVALFPSRLGFGCWRTRRWRRAKKKGEGEGPRDYGFRL